MSNPPHSLYINDKLVHKQKRNIRKNPSLIVFSVLQGDRKLSVLIGYFMVFLLHVIGLYLWYWNDNLFYPLLMVPPKTIPPFWHAIFTIVVNGMDFHFLWQFAMNNCVYTYNNDFNSFWNCIWALYQINIGDGIKCRCWIHKLT